jgi:hypothetical protein
MSQGGVSNWLRDFYLLETVTSNIFWDYCYDIYLCYLSLFFLNLLVFIAVVGYD